MKKLAIVAALLLVAFTACKKEEEQQQQQEQPAQVYLTADFSMRTGGYWGRTGWYESGGDVYDFIEDNLSVVVFDLSVRAEQYLWEWGDGEQTYNCATYPYYDWSSSNPYCGEKKYNNHKYSEPGTYTITLTVANGDGETDCKSKTVTIL